MSDNDKQELIAAYSRIKQLDAECIEFQSEIYDLKEKIDVRCNEINDLIVRIDILRGCEGCDS